MEKAELAAIRKQIASEPEGSVARKLLAEVDRLTQEANERALAEIRAVFREHDFTDAEIEKAVLLVQRGKSPPLAHGPCRHCAGQGFVSEPGCIDVSLVKCPKCHGSRERVQFIPPEDSEVLAAIAEAVIGN